MKLSVYQINNKVSPKQCWIAELSDQRESFFSPPSETREQALSGLLLQVVKVSLIEKAKQRASRIQQEIERPLPSL